MNDLFEIHNLFLQSVNRFKDDDPQLKRLNNLPYTYQSPLISHIAHLPYGIYTLTGGRQVGKTTLIKQIILYLLNESAIPPSNIFYITGEVIQTFSQLIEEIRDFLSLEKPAEGKQTFLFIDEVTYVREWHRGIKFCADAGMFENTLVLISGSDTVFLKEMIQMLPGRRGKSDVVDFHYYPLSFKEFLEIRDSVSADVLETIPEKSEETAPDTSRVLYRELDLYCRTGGYLTAMNDVEMFGQVQAATYKTYFDWILGDVLKRNKNEHYLKELLSAIIKQYNSQITWNSLGSDLSFQHHVTVQEYCTMLQAMDALCIINALREDKLSAAPKKAKKIYFTDPFITHAVCRCMKMHQLDNAALIEAICLNHLRRKFPTYYIKAKKEIDCAYIDNKKIYPVEIKWTENLKPLYFVHLQHYPRSILGARVIKETSVMGIPVVPLPVLLVRFS